MTTATLEGPLVECGKRAADVVAAAAPKARRKPRAKADTANRGSMPNQGTRAIVDVPLDKIHRHPSNRTIAPKTCKQLAKDFERRGLLSPVQIRDPGAGWNLPEGHYQIVFGERRVIAARLAGWDTIPAEIVQLSDQQAQEAITAENGHREPLNDIERAQRLAACMRPIENGGGGMTQTAAAEAMGIDQSTASTLLGLLKLPQDWQDLVIAGAMPGSHLRPLLKYADCPRLLEVLWQDYDECMASKWPEERAAWATREAIEENVAIHVIVKTRPLTAEDLLPDEDPWRKPSFEPPAELQSLDVVGVPVGRNQTVKRCLQIDAWQNMQEAGTKSKSNGKTAKPKKLSDVEQRKREADEDRELAERIARPGGLAEQGLRWVMAAAISKVLQQCGGNVATHLAGEVLLDAARESCGSSHLQTCEWRYLAWRLVRADRAENGGVNLIKTFKDHKAYGTYTAESLDTSEDWISDSLMQRGYTAKLILFPSDERITDPPRLAKWGTWPDRWTWVDNVILKRLAKSLKVSIKDTWAAAQKPGAARRWLELLIATHNTRRQRQALCDELGVASHIDATLDAMATAIVTAHSHRLLPMPAGLK